MNQRYINLAIILVLLIVSIYVDVGGVIPILNKGLPTKQGLDLQGGIQALLEVDLPASTKPLQLSRWPMPAKSLKTASTVWV